MRNAEAWCPIPCSRTVLAVREDVGRHNAVHKGLGWAAENRRIPHRGNRSPVRHTVWVRATKLVLLGVQRAFADDALFA